MVEREFVMKKRLMCMGACVCICILMLVCFGCSSDETVYVKKIIDADGKNSEVNVICYYLHSVKIVKLKKEQIEGLSSWIDSTAVEKLEFEDGATEPDNIGDGVNFEYSSDSFDTFTYYDVYEQGYYYVKAGSKWYKVHEPIDIGLQNLD